MLDDHYTPFKNLNVFTIFQNPIKVTPSKCVRSKKLIAVHSKFTTLVTICFFIKSDSLLIVWTCDTLRMFFLSLLITLQENMHTKLIVRLLEVLHRGDHNRFEPHRRFPVMFGY